MSPHPGRLGRVSYFKDPGRSLLFPSTGKQEESSFPYVEYKSFPLVIFELTDIRWLPSNPESFAKRMHRLV